MNKNNTYWNYFKEFFLAFIFFYISIILLCDQKWEPTDETYKHYTF